MTCWTCPTKCFELSVVRFHLIVVEPPTLNITCFKNNVLCQLVRDDACFICQSSDLASCGSALWRVLLTADKTSRTFSGRSPLSSSCLSRNKSGPFVWPPLRVCTGECCPRRLFLRLHICMCACRPLFSLSGCFGHGDTRHIL